MDRLSDYFEDRREYAESLGVEVVYDNKHHKTFPGNQRVVGYFCESEMVCYGAAKHPEFAPTMVHEYCHMDQWLSGIPEWSDYQAIHDEYDLEGWLAKKVVLDNHEICAAIKVTQALELDCEKRAVKQILKYDLPINLDKYVRQANAYMYHIATVPIMGSHPKTVNSPLRTPECWRLMPNYFIDDYEDIPQEFLIAAREHCYR